MVVETPLPFGPRNCGQSSAAVLVNGSNAIPSAIDMAKIVILPLDVALSFSFIGVMRVETIGLG